MGVSPQNGWRHDKSREERGGVGWSSQEDLMEEKGFEYSLEGRVGFGCTEPFGENIPG